MTTDYALRHGTYLWLSSYLSKPRCDRTGVERGLKARHLRYPQFLLDRFRQDSSEHSILDKKHTASNQSSVAFLNRRGSMAPSCQNHPSSHPTGRFSGSMTRWPQTFWHFLEPFGFNPAATSPRSYSGSGPPKPSKCKGCFRGHLGA